MSQQSLDLRTSLRIARRYRVLIGGLATVGLLAGIGYTVINPPKATSEALVVIPQLTSSSDATVTNTGTVVTSGTETQVLVAGSDPVLQAALPGITPAMSLPELRVAVQTSNPAGAIIAIDGHSTSGAQAIDIANAVAKSYVAYVTSAKSPARVNASLLEPAATSTGDSLVVGLLPGAVIGLLAGALIGFIIALAKGRNERRLRQRDAIANAIGVPVLASMPVAHPSDAAAWTELLDEYEPSVVPAWQLRKMLSQLGIPSVRSSDGEGGALSLAVLSLSSDKRALALGPQLATFAASLGIRTVLAIGQEQDPAGGATLYTACAVAPGVAPRRGRPLQTKVVGGKEAADVSDGAELVVLVIVSDGAVPRMPDTMRTDLTVLGVSAGAATAEELARIAMAADSDGRGITGILVADPDSTDRTTGRIPQLAGIRRRIPTRTTGIPTESRR